MDYIMELIGGFLGILFGLAALAFIIGVPLLIIWALGAIIWYPIGQALTASRKKRYCDTGNHRWSGCRCSICGKPREHVWKDCRCERCGWPRGSNHDLDENCVCRVCGREEHNFNSGVCSRCGVAWCSECGGSGETSCSGCGGMGIVSDGLSCGGTGDCPACHGSGKLSCDRCGGSGVSSLSRKDTCFLPGPLGRPMVRPSTPYV